MSEAARVRESIDLAEFERRLRGAPAEAPQTAYGYEPASPAQFAEAPVPAARPAYPRTADLADARAAAANPVADLRVALEDAATRPDQYRPEHFQPAAARYQHEAPAYAAAPQPVPLQAASVEEPGWRPEAFEPIDGADKGARRKRYLLLGGAAAVLVVGVGVTLGMRGGPTGANAPTIRASSDPFKIQPEAKPAGQKPSESASILDRNGSERIAASRVVTREEQPVDVREAARQASATNSAAPRPGPSTGAPPAGLPTAGPAANSFFPEPRRVRTVSVRPDGTIIGDFPKPAPVAAPRAAPSRPATSATPSPAPAPVPPVPAAAPPAPGPQTSAPAPTRVASIAPPKTSERAIPTAVSTTASTAVAATPSAPPAARANSPDRSTVASTPRTEGGGYAVQLAGAGSESDARAEVARVQQRFASVLSGLEPTVRKATVGSREVYRVRVVGLSQSDASGLCEKLKSAGGTCFVARE